jgi:hypothetical protein
LYMATFLGSVCRRRRVSTLRDNTPDECGWFRKLLESDASSD